jgi:hypothetical protein
VTEQQIQRLLAVEAVGTIIWIVGVIVTHFWLGWF